MATAKRYAKALRAPSLNHWLRLTFPEEYVQATDGLEAVADQADAASAAASFSFAQLPCEIQLRCCLALVPRDLLKMRCVSRRLRDLCDANSEALWGIHANELDKVKRLFNDGNNDNNDKNCTRDVQTSAAASRSSFSRFRTSWLELCDGVCTVRSEQRRINDEIISTEVSYIHGLETLLSMVESASEAEQSSQATSILRAFFSDRRAIRRQRDLNLVRNDVPQLIELHKQFVTSINSTCDPKTLASAMIDHESRLRGPIMRYIEAWELKLQAIQRLQSVQNVDDLASFGILPVARLSRYRLLIGELEQITFFPADLDALQSCRSIVQDTIREINDRVTARRQS